MRSLSANCWLVAIGSTAAVQGNELTCETSFERIESDVEYKFFRPIAVDGWVVAVQFDTKANPGHSVAL